VGAQGRSPRKALGLLRLDVLYLLKNNQPNQIRTSVSASDHLDTLPFLFLFPFPLSLSLSLSLWVAFPLSLSISLLPFFLPFPFVSFPFPLSLSRSSFDFGASGPWTLSDDGSVLIDFEKRPLAPLLCCRSSWPMPLVPAYLINMHFGQVTVAAPTLHTIERNS